MTDQFSDDKIYGSFDGFTELKKLQDVIIRAKTQVDMSEEEQTEKSVIFQKFTTLLDTYQEQSYLLDPYLEQLVGPVVDALNAYVKVSIANPTDKGDIWHGHRVAETLYSYVKFRGYKTIIRFFPHEIADLSIALEFMQIPNGIVGSRWHWPVRYVMLLWLYIICLIPFDLAQFDETDKIGQTAKTLESVAKTYIGAAGLEKEAAALLLSRLYIRKDAGPGFHDFVQWSEQFLKTTKDDFFKAIGILKVLCEVVKAGSAEQVQEELPSLLSIARIIEQTSTYSNNTIIRKLRTKLVSRIGLRLLPTTSGNIKRQARTLAADDGFDLQDENQEEIEVPEEIEDILEQTFTALQDRDTVVRWSAAKGVARIAQRLPKDFSGQVLETVMGLFEIHSVAGATLYDLPAIAEGTWHGACLACAELARRSLVEPTHLPQLIGWLSKALYFDLRKGAHSIGSNVRDAAAYVLWALARTQNQSALIPHATDLAQRLTAVALFDREIHIRRAASAAFQEHVGRNSLFPHGIDVLGKTDFYAVSKRKHAFLVAAPQVSEHAEYRNFLLDHLLDIVLRHWDLPMRELGSQSLRLLCSIDLHVLGPRAIEKSVKLLESLDTSDVHGGLTALSEVALAYKEANLDPSVLEDNLRGIFQHLKLVHGSTLSTTRNELIASAACRMLANSITITEINLGAQSTVPGWKSIVDTGLKHRIASVQEAAAEAMKTISNLTDCSSDLIVELKRGPPIMQQGLARLLGVINYSTHPKSLHEALTYLLDTVKPARKAAIETRRSCFWAIPEILTSIAPQLTSHVSSDVVNTLVDAMLGGLEDYTLDERGDVGSWVRIACIQGLTTISELLFGVGESIPDFESYFSPQKYFLIATGLLKQGVERLDNVRQTAGICFVKLLNMPLPLVHGSERWRLPAISLLNDLFQNSSDESGWNDGNWLFPRGMRLLGVPQYRKDVLSGIVISVGSKTDSTQKPVTSSLVNFAQGLPTFPTTTSPYSILGLVEDLLDHTKLNMTLNTVVIPVFQTFTILLEADVLRQIPDEPKGLHCMKTLLHMTTKNIDKLKSVQRIHEAMKIFVNLLSFEQIRSEKIALIGDFLAHSFPKVRSETAEYLYVLLQSVDLGIETDAIEDILLETEWSTGDREVAKSAANEVIELFST